MKKYNLNYVHHSDIKHGERDVYSTPTEKAVVIKAATEKKAIEEAKKEWARITAQRASATAVVFDSFVQVIGWKPRKREVHLS